MDDTTRDMDTPREPSEERDDRSAEPQEGGPSSAHDQAVDFTPDAESEPESSPQESSVSDGRVKELEQQVAQYKDLFLRKAADFDNFKRRSENEISLLAKFANEDLVLAFLPVVDDIERALRSAKDDDGEGSLRRGLELILQKIMKLLESNGVKPMHALGKSFDVNYHDVLLQIQRPDVLPHTIVEEVERGFLMHERVIRHAKVIVAAGPDEGTAEIPDQQSAPPRSTPPPGAG